MNAENRAVLVIDEMPKECIECQFCRVFADNKPTETWCLLTAKRNEDGVNKRAEWCPLKPLPPKLDANDWHRMFSGLFSEREAKGYGWNACIDEILGEKE